MVALLLVPYKDNFLDQLGSWPKKRLIETVCLPRTEGKANES